jgi:hypothetical protein
VEPRCCCCVGSEGRGRCSWSLFVSCFVVGFLGGLVVGWWLDMKIEVEVEEQLICTYQGAPPMLALEDGENLLRGNGGRLLLPQRIVGDPRATCRMHSFVVK